MFRPLCLSFPTRINNALDVFLTNRPTLVNKCEPIPGISDHDTAVFVDSNILPKRQRPIKRKIHKWGKTDKEGIKKVLASFSKAFTSKNTTQTLVDTLWSQFSTKCKSTMDHHIPCKMTSQRFDQTWISPEVKRLARRKKRYHSSTNKLRAAKGQS